MKNRTNFLLLLLILSWSNNILRAQPERIQVPDIEQYSLAIHNKVYGGYLIERRYYSNYEIPNSYLFTTDFQSFKEVKSIQPLQVSHVFLIKDTLYFLSIFNSVASNRSLIKLNSDLSIDTVAYIETNSYSLNFSSLHLGTNILYITNGQNHFSFNVNNRKVDRILFPDSLKNKHNFHLVDSGIFYFDEFLYFKHNDSISPHIVDSSFNKSNYLNLNVFFNFEWDNKIIGVFDDTILGIKVAVSTDLIGNHVEYPFSPIGHYNLDDIKVEYRFKNMNGGKSLPIFEIFCSTSKDGGYKDIIRFNGFIDTISKSVFIDKDSIIVFQNLISRDIPVYEVNGKQVLFYYSDSTGVELFEFRNNRFILVKDIYGGLSGSFQTNTTNTLIFKDNHIYFLATHPKYGYTIYKSDGSIENTIPLMKHKSQLFISELIIIEDNLYFNCKESLDNYWYMINLNDSKNIKPSEIIEKSWTKTFSNGFNDVNSKVYNGQFVTRKTKNHIMVAPLPASNSSRFMFMPENSIYKKIDNGHLPFYHIVNIHNLNGDVIKSVELMTSKYDFGFPNVISLPDIDENLNVYLCVDYSPRFGFTHNSNLVINSDTIYDWKPFVKIIKVDTNNIVNVVYERDFSNFKLRLKKFEVDSNGDFVVLLSGQMIDYMFYIDKFGNEKELIELNKEKYESNNFYLDRQSGLIYIIKKYDKFDSRDNFIRIETFDYPGNKKLWTSEFYSNKQIDVSGIESTNKGEVWVVGRFGDYINHNNKQLIRFNGDKYQLNGYLFRLSKSSGTLLKSEFNLNGFYDFIHVNNNDVYTYFYNNEINYKKEKDSRFNSNGFIISKWNTHGDLVSEYKNPISFAMQASKSTIHIYPSINEKDFYLISGVKEKSVAPYDTLFQPSMDTRNDLHYVFGYRVGEIFEENSIEKLNSPNKKETYIIRPNPVTKSYVIVDGKVGDNPFHSYRLVSLDGRIVYENTIEQLIFPFYLRIPFNLNGVYILQLYSPSEVSNHKIIIVSD